jgi:hypothetical protein
MNLQARFFLQKGGCHARKKIFVPFVGVNTLPFSDSSCGGSGPR